MPHDDDTMPQQRTKDFDTRLRQLMADVSPTLCEVQQEFVTAGVDALSEAVVRGDLSHSTLASVVESDRTCLLEAFNEADDLGETMQEELRRGCGLQEMILFLQREVSAILAAAEAAWDAARAASAAEEDRP